MINPESYTILIYNLLMNKSNISTWQSERFLDLKKPLLQLPLGLHTPIPPIPNNILKLLDNLRKRISFNIEELAPGPIVHNIGHIGRHNLLVQRQIGVQVAQERLYFLKDLDCLWLNEVQADLNCFLTYTGVRDVLDALYDGLLLLQEGFVDF